MPLDGATCLGPPPGLNLEPMADHEAAWFKDGGLGLYALGGLGGPGRLRALDTDAQPYVGPGDTFASGRPWRGSSAVARDPSRDAAALARAPRRSGLESLPLALAAPLPPPPAIAFTGTWKDQLGNTIKVDSSATGLVAHAVGTRGSHDWKFITDGWCRVWCGNGMLHQVGYPAESGPQRGIKIPSHFAWRTQNWQISVWERIATRMLPPGPPPTQPVAEVATPEARAIAAAAAAACAGRAAALGAAAEGGGYGGVGRPPGASEFPLPPWRRDRGVGKGGEVVAW